MIDTTYWGKDFGVVVFKDAISGKFIWWHFINHKERLEDYKLGFKCWRKQGYIIKGVVSDGFKGLAKIISPIPFGICQFHIQRAVIKKLTRKPPSGPSSKKSIAGMKLLALSKELFKLSKDEFKTEPQNWQEKHKDFLNEKTIDENGKWRYTHTKVRSAHLTFKRNLAFLFTYEMPKTNNGLKSEFAHLKTALRTHSGLKLTNKMSLFHIILG